MTNQTVHEYSPMRGGLFERWLLVWHTLYISGLLVTLGVALWRARGGWGWRELALVAVVAILIAMYLRVIAFARHWPHSGRFMLLYYAVTIGLLALATWLNPVFTWTTGMLIGQMLGVLPPAIAAPAVILTILVWSIELNDWQIPEGLTITDSLVIAAQIGMILLLYLYIYHLIRTSQERAQLVNELSVAKAALEKAQDDERELAMMRERERMARDLHDGLGHALVTLSMQLEAVQRLYRVDPERASAQVDELKRLTRESMSALRGAIEGLRAPGLDGEVLSAAIGRLCVGLSQRCGITMRCDVAPAANELPPALADVIWRVTQEALVNIERHASAREAVVNLSVTLDESTGRRKVTLTVADNGLGLPDGAESRPGHFGLRGMRERVEGLGGIFTIGSNGQEGGTRITAGFPLV